MFTMERLFSPCTRLHDRLERQGRLEEVRRRHPEPLQELNLNVSTEEFLSAERAFTYADLHDMLGDDEDAFHTVLWLTPHASGTRNGGVAVDAWLQLHGSCCFSFNADGKDVTAFARSSEHLLEICEIVVRLLAVSVVHSVILQNGLRDVFINAPALAYLMEQCQSLQILSLKDLEMDEDHCRVLGAYSRPGLEFSLECCKFTDAGASALAEVLGRNQGPTKLDECEIDNVVFANGLRGNSRLKRLKVAFSRNVEVADRQLHAILGALKENKGLVDLNLGNGFSVNDEIWGAICNSLKTHPTLEVLILCGTFRVAVPTPALVSSRIQTLVDMMKVNMSIHTMLLDPRYSQHEIFRVSVIPYLETNRLRPHLFAIQRTRPITYRAKVLGRALLTAHTDANSFWMLLSGNCEVAFPSSTTTNAAAGNLITAATTAATSNANVAATALTTIATDSLLTNAAETAAISAATPSTDSDVAAAAAGNVAGPSPSACQKRKARP
jgi:hypothetical protein